MDVGKDVKMYMGSEWMDVNGFPFSLKSKYVFCEMNE